ncbi:PKD domain-containing protein [Vulgatibacter incomptus]|nr:PKD domain-containing protein [Vulgatibacter incomptus]
MNGRIAGGVIAADRMGAPFSASAVLLSSPTGVDSQLTSSPSVTWSGTTVSQGRGMTHLDHGRPWRWLDMYYSVSSEELIGIDLEPVTLNEVELTCVEEIPGRGCDFTTGFFTAGRAVGADTLFVTKPASLGMTPTSPLPVRGGGSPILRFQPRSAGGLSFSVAASSGLYNAVGGDVWGLEAKPSIPGTPLSCAGGLSCRSGDTVQPIAVNSNEHVKVDLRLDTLYYYQPPAILLGARVTGGRVYLSAPPEAEVERLIPIDEEVKAELHIWNGPDICPAEVELFAAHDPNQTTLLRFPINPDAGIQSVSVLADDVVDRIVPIGQAVQFSVSAVAPACTTLAYEWDFGDDTTSTEKDPTHTYTTTGIYKPRVRVSCGSCPSSTVDAFADVGVFSIKMTSPSGDPTSADPEEIENSEFVFSGAGGVLKIPVAAEIEPSSLGSRVGENLRWRFDNGSRPDAIPAGSALSWDATWPTDASAGRGARNVARLNGYPQNNADFGRRLIQLEYVDAGEAVWSQTQTIELFFSKDDVASGRGVPNWFFYWGQVLPSTVSREYRKIPPTLASYGQFPAMVWWRYGRTFAYSKNEVRVFRPAAGQSRAIACAGIPVLTGIDLFISTLRHEKRHVEQMRSADGLVSTGSDGPWLNGWSWNGAHNHWAVGEDGVPGAPGDDNGFPGDDDLLLLDGPGELGANCLVGGVLTPSCADVPLFHLADPYQTWPQVWGQLPGGCEDENLIERDAYNHDLKNDKGYLASDWAAPGKQYRTEAYDD